MPSNERQSQQKRPTTTKRIEWNPVTYSDPNDQDVDMTEEDVLVEDDPLASNPPRPHTSAIRLNNPANSSRRLNGQTGQQTGPVSSRRNGQAIPTSFYPMHVRSGRNTTIQQPFVSIEKPQKNVHWLLYVGVGMVAALALWVVGSSVLAFGIAKYNDLIYGNPRTFQSDAIVGHGGDSTQHPSHFIALNLNGQVMVIELMAGNPAKSISYTGPYLFDGAQTPITLEFRDVNHDKKPDMIIHIQDKMIIFLNDGTKFVPPKG